MKIDLCEYLLYGTAFRISKDEYYKLIELITSPDVEYAESDSIRSLKNAGFIFSKGGKLYFNRDVIFPYGVRSEGKHEYKELYNDIKELME